MSPGPGRVQLGFAPPLPGLGALLSWYRSSLLSPWELGGSRLARLLNNCDSTAWLALEDSGKASLQDQRKMGKGLGSLGLCTKWVGRECQSSRDVLNDKDKEASQQQPGLSAETKAFSRGGLQCSKDGGRGERGRGGAGRT